MSGKKNESKITKADEAIVIKVIQEENYSSDIVNEFVEEAKKKLTTDYKLNKACVLQGEDTVSIYNGGASIRVVPPQKYCDVMVLDRTNSVFEEDLGNGPEFMGCFYGSGRDYTERGEVVDTNDAVTGSGCDRWYKVSHEFVKFCKDVDQQACALDRQLDHIVDCVTEGVPVNESFGRLAKPALGLLLKKEERKMRDLREQATSIKKRIERSLLRIALFTGKG